MLSNRSSRLNGQSILLISDHKLQTRIGVITLGLLSLPLPLYPQNYVIFTIIIIMRKKMSYKL